MNVDVPLWRPVGDRWADLRICRCAIWACRLGYGVALGFCAAFGTLIPAIHDGSIIKLLTTMPGWVVLSGILVCLLGIAVCGYAGHLKEAGD